MSFSGDNIVIKDDYSFERIENLKLGDIIVGPEGETIITKITTEYNSNNYLLKSNNFFPFYLGPNTKILTSKEFELYDKNKNEYISYLKPKEFVDIKNIFPTNLLCLEPLKLQNQNNFQNAWLYGLVLSKAEIKINDKNEINLICKNIANYLNKIKDSDILLNINRHEKIIYLNNIYYEWAKDLKVKESKKKINNKLFISNDKEIKEFLNIFIKHNSKAYLNEKEFRCYIESKILGIQLFYLLAHIYNELPIIEQVSKDRVEYKKIVQSDKKKKYSVTMLNDLKTLKINETFYQEIEKINSINKEIRMYNIETLDNKPFYLNNIIVKG